MKPFTLESKSPCDCFVQHGAAMRQPSGCCVVTVLANKYIVRIRSLVTEEQRVAVVSCSFECARTWHLEQATLRVPDCLLRQGSIVCRDVAGRKGFVNTNIAALT